jgi:hypothetical protein
MKPARLACVTLFFCALLSCPTAGSAGEIGVFLDNLTDCTIRSASGSSSCRKDGIISSGDLIKTKQNPHSLPIQWLAPGNVRLEPAAAGQFRVAFTPPRDVNRVFAVLGDLAGFTRKAGRIAHSAVTRGALDTRPMLPGDEATLMPGRLVTFSWCAAGVRKIAILDETGAKVREFAVAQGERSLTLKTEDLGLSAGVAYRWLPVGATAEGGRIALLEDGAAKPLSDALLSIEKGEGTAVEKGLKQGAYLQFVSQNYPDDYALGWLQYGVASGLPAELATADRAAAERLKVAGVNRYCD